MKLVKTQRCAATVIRLHGKSDPRNSSSEQKGSMLSYNLLGKGGFLMHTIDIRVLHNTTSILSDSSFMEMAGGVHKPGIIPEGFREQTPLEKFWHRLREVISKPDAFELPDNWADMAGSGFWMKKQMNKLPAYYSPEQAAIWISQTEKDTHGYTLEYLAKRGVFPIMYEMERRDGEDILTAPFYGGQRVADVVSAQERNGASRDTMLEAEKYFATASEGAIMVITSPRDENGTDCGLIDPDSNQPIILPDSQRYVFQLHMEQGKRIVKGFTIRTDSTLKEERRFLEMLTGTTIDPSADPEVYVRTIARIDPKVGGIQTIEDIVNIMQRIRGGDRAYYNARSQTYLSWNDIRHDIRREDLWDFPQQTGQIFATFQEFAQRLLQEEDAPEIRWLLQRALAVTLLEIGQYLKGKTEEKGRRESQDIAHSNHFTDAPRHPYMPPTSSYGSVLKTMRATGGCSSSSTNEKSDSYTNIIEHVIESLAPRIGNAKLTEDSHGSREVECPDCHQISIRPEGGLLTNCLNCNSNAISCDPTESNTKKQDSAKSNKLPAQTTENQKLTNHVQKGENNDKPHPPRRQVAATTRQK